MLKSEIRELIKKWMPFKFDIFGIDRSVFTHIADEIYYYLDAEYPVSCEQAGEVLYSLIVSIGAQKRYKPDVTKEDCIAMSQHILALFEKYRADKE